MATTIWCELVCAHCAAVVAAQYTSGKVPRKALKSDAKAAGCVFSYDDVFCSEEHRLAAQPKHILEQSQEVKS